MKHQHPVIVRLALTCGRERLTRRPGQQDIDIA
jgi:hypothetical protein